MVEVVNVVASGDLQQELDLDHLVQDLDVLKREYTPDIHPGLHLRFDEEGPLLTLYRSGSYVIMGAKTQEAVDEVFSQLQRAFDGLGIEISSTGTTPTIQNIICKDYLDREVNLSALAVELKLENVEYEPEQSPFLYYWPEEYDCVLSIPANGQVVVTGILTKEEAQATFTHLKERIDTLLEAS